MLSPNEIAEIKALSTESIKQFVQWFWHILNPGTKFLNHWVTDCILEHCQLLCDGKIKGLHLNLPPGTGKSQALLVWLPAYLWITRPHFKGLNCSYSEDLGIEKAFGFRRLIKDPLYQQCFNFDPLITDTNELVVNDKTGEYKVISSTGAVTGWRANWYVIDDILNVNSVNYDKEREQALRFFKALTTRIGDNDCFRVVGTQRTHRFDLSNFILETQKDLWCNVSIPWEFKNKYFLSPYYNDKRKTENEPLFPHLYGDEYIKTQRQTIGEGNFEIQYNQNVVDSEQQLFLEKNLRYYNNLPKGILLLSCDPASTEGSGDFTAIISAIIDDFGSIYIQDIFRKQIDLMDILPKLDELNAKLKPDMILVEKAGQMGFWEGQGRIMGLPIRAVKPMGNSKPARAVQLRILVENNKLFLPSNAKWKNDFINELISFPSGSHSDCVDALAYLAIEARRYFYNEAPPPPPPPVYQPTTDQEKFEILEQKRLQAQVDIQAKCQEWQDQLQRAKIEWLNS